MVTLIVALVAIALSGLDYLPLPPDTVPPQLVQYREFILISLVLVIVIDTIVRNHLVRKRLAAAAQPAEAPAPVAPAPPVEPPKPPKEEPPQVGEALVLLSLLQEKGRFLDFLMEDITAYQDAQVAAASRVVHQGCSSVIREYLDISPAHDGKEGERITVDTASDPNRYRLVGKVLGEPPYSGVVIHRGWKTARLSLPRFNRPVDPSGTNTITPVEVEVR